MTRIPSRLHQIATASLCAAAACAAQGQGAETPQAPQATQALDTVVVSGLRASMLKGEVIKRNAVGVVESINAEDIGKFADRSLGEAAQRIPGVQVQRNNGEVQSVVLRGLPDIATTLDGMNFYTGHQRRFSYQDLPIIAVGRIDVKKTWTADLIEGGGMAGLVDARLRRPFDTKGLKAGGYVTGRWIDTQGSEGKTSRNATAGVSVSQRVKTDLGEIGALFNASHFQEEWASPFMAMLVGDPQRVYLVNTATGNGTLQRQPASGVYPAAPAGSVYAEVPGFESAFNHASRQRSVAHAGLQWRPSDKLELNVHGLFIDFHGVQKNSVLAANPRGNSTTTTTASGTLTNAVVAPFDERYCSTPLGAVCPMLSFRMAPVGAQPLLNSSLRALDLTTRNKQLGLDGTYRDGAFKLMGNLMASRSNIHNHGYRVDLVPRAANGAALTVGGVYHPNEGGHGAFSLSGFDPNAENAWRFGTYQENWMRNFGKEWHASLASEYQLDLGILKTLKAGLRVAERKAGSSGITSANFNVAAGASTDVPAGSMISLPGLTRGGGAFQAMSTGYVFDNVSTLKTRFGVPAGELPENPSQRYGVKEKNAALYLASTLEFELGGIDVRGEAGVRVARVTRNITANQVRGGTVVGQFDQVGQNTEALPSAAFVVEWMPSLQSQFGANKTLSYPNFVDLSPGVALTVPPVGVLRGTGTGGNPALKALESNNVDATLEYYFARNGYVAGAVFYRDITGYIQRFNQTESYDGIDYNVSRPQNAGRGRLKGVELSAQRFFDFMPEPWNKFGAQVSYTYIDGRNQSRLADGSFRADPLVQVARESYTAVGMFEGYGLTGRIAYTHRGNYTDALATGAMNLPIITRAAGTLDLGIGYEINKHVSVQFDAMNLTGSNLEQYLGDPIRPTQIRFNPKFYQLGLRFKL